MRHARLKKENVSKESAAVNDRTLAMEFSAGVSNAIFTCSILGLSPGQRDSQVDAS